MFEESIIRDRLGDMTTLRSVITLIMPLAHETLRLRLASEAGAGREELDPLIERVADAKEKFASSLSMMQFSPCDNATVSHTIASAMEVAMFVADKAMENGDDPEKAWQDYLIRMSSNRRPRD